MQSKHSEIQNAKEFIGYGTAKAKLYGKKVVICLTHLMKPGYLTLIASLVEELTKTKTSIFIFDITSHEIDTRQDKFGATRKRLLDIFYNYVLSIDGNIVLVSLAQSSLKDRLTEYINLNEEQYLTLNDFFRIRKSSPNEEQSIRSYLATHEIRSLDADFPLNRYIKRILKDILEEFNYVSLAWQTLIKNFDVDFVLIQNGRWRSQPILDSLSRNMHINVLYYNVAYGKSGTMFLEDYVIQNVKAHQARYLKSNLRLHFEPKYMDWFVSDFLSRNKHRSGRFHIASGSTRADFQSKTQGEERKLATIFISSPNEFDFFSNINDGWGGQTEAVLLAHKSLQNFGFRVIVRFHPNQQNYSFRDVLSMITKFREHSIDYVLPWETYSSYELVEKSDLVVVWQSTIGLEAWLDEKRVICLANNAYNDLAGVPTATNLKTFEKYLNHPVKLTKFEKGFRTIHYLRFYGEDLELHNNSKLDELDRSLASIAMLSKKRKKSNGLEHLSYLLMKSSFFTKITNLSMVEIHWILSKFVGRNLAIRLITWSVE